MKLNCGRVGREMLPHANITRTHIEYVRFSPKVVIRSHRCTANGDDNPRRSAHSSLTHLSTN